MDEKKLTADNELKEIVDKLISDVDILLQIISKLQDVRYLYLTDKMIDIEKLTDDLDALNDKFQIIEILE